MNAEKNLCQMLSLLLKAHQTSSLDAAHDAVCQLISLFTLYEISFPASEEASNIYYQALSLLSEINAGLKRKRAFQACQRLLYEYSQEIAHD